MNSIPLTNFDWWVLVSSFVRFSWPAGLPPRLRRVTGPDREGWKGLRPGTCKCRKKCGSSVVN